MQKSNCSIGHSKHHKAFGKTNRNPTVNLRIAKELNAEHERLRALRKRMRNPMFGSVLELIKSR